MSDVGCNLALLVVRNFLLLNKQTNIAYGICIAVAQWLRCCATNQKVAGSIPAGVSGFFIDIKSFR